MGLRGHTLWVGLWRLTLDRGAACQALHFAIATVRRCLLYTEATECGSTTERDAVDTCENDVGDH